MQTADFLPPQAFREHLDRRRTPRRVAIVCALALLLTPAGVVVERDTRQVEMEAMMARIPDKPLADARTELDGLIFSVSDLRERMNPLVAHLSRERSAGILAGIGRASGDTVRFDSIQWSYETERNERGEETGTWLILSLAGSLRGEQALLDIRDRLRLETGIEDVELSGTRIDPADRTLIRFDVVLRRLQDQGAAE